jgi:hypothetical protein
MKKFEFGVAAVVITGLVLLTLYRDSSVLEWIAIIATILFVAFLFAYHIIWKH